MGTALLGFNFHAFDQKIVKILKRNFPKVETVSKAGFPKILENMKNKSINMFAFIDNREKLQLFSAFTKGNSSSSSVA